jgi:hypothetical protein
VKTRLHVEQQGVHGHPCAEKPVQMVERGTRRLRCIERDQDFHCWSWTACRRNGAGAWRMPRAAELARSAALFVQEVLRDEAQG